MDRVVEWEKEKYAVGYKNVTVNDNFFTGHFPERPIMPGAGGRAGGKLLMRTSHVTPTPCGIAPRDPSRPSYADAAALCAQIN